MADYLKKLTQKSVEVVNAAAELAQSLDHQQLVPLHLAVVLFEDAQGVAKEATLKAHGPNGEETWRGVGRQLRQRLSKLPRVQGRCNRALRTGAEGYDPIQRL